MGSEKELIVFIVLINAILFTFIVGVVFFILQYRKRKILHGQEVSQMIEKHNQELLLSQMQVQQQAMQDVGKEIHDNLGQKLTLASIYLHKVVRNFKDIKQEQIEEVNTILDESLREIRRLSISLIKSDVQHLSLADLVANDLKRLENLYKVKSKLVCSNQLPPMSSFYIINIHRIIQEFIQNSIKHAQPSLIEIGFQFQNNQLILTCQDDGKGFDIQLVSKGNGLSNIQRRTTDLVGQLTWQSELNKGTTLNVAIPIS